jgi:flavin-dependent dehydrogenase
MAALRRREWWLPSTRCGRAEEARLPSWDVAIVGGGPAGSAAALTLRERYPTLSVGLLEASLFDEPRVGEILSPAAAPVLEHLGISEAALRECSRPAHASAVSWGRDALVESPLIFSFHGPGWRLNRTRFDALLAEVAEQRGVTVLRGCRAVRPEHAGGEWLFHLGSGETGRSRFTIDATGRKASVARAAGARIMALDRLVGFIGCFDSFEEGDPRTLIESVDYGWWYTAALNGGLRIAACMTDGDIGRDLKLSNRESWRDRLCQTVHIAAALGKDSVTPRWQVARSAASHYLDCVCGVNWIACGDAALALDPLSGQGILAALRSGIFAGYAMGDWIRDGDSSALSRYKGFIERTRDGYLQARRRYYSEELRWRDCTFWQRRREAPRPFD